MSTSDQVQQITLAETKARLVAEGRTEEEADEIIDLMTNPDREDEFVAGFAAFMDKRFPPESEEDKAAVQQRARERAGEEGIGY
jgi:hypothetical protein